MHISANMGATEDAASRRPGPHRDMAVDCLGAQIVMPFAHGIGGVRDLPVPESFFFVTAAIVLVVSFVLLGVLWRRPLLDRHQEGRRLPRRCRSFSFHRVLRVVLGLVSVALLVLTLTTALLGTTIVLLNFTPTFVYVIFWLGLPLLSVLLGNVWRVLSPWRAIADATVWAIERTGRVAQPGPRLTLALRPLSGRRRALRVRRARARTSEAGSIRARWASRSRSTATGRSQGWPCSAAMRGRRAERGSPSRSRCSRGSHPSPCETGPSSCAGRSSGSAGRSGCRARSSSSPCCSARPASTASSGRLPGRT